jgi:hypothetical protein
MGATTQLLSPSFQLDFADFSLSHFDHPGTLSTTHGPYLEQSTTTWSTRLLQLLDGHRHSSDGHDKFKCRG